MPHFRPRHALEVFKNVASYSPLVGVFGHRQVGKTTFVEKLSKSYCSFDAREVREAARANPSTFLSKLGPKPAVIDECQIVPDIFPELKEYVRLHKKPGQLILTGSVRFYSRVGIRESLTGRIGNVEILPFCLTEILQQARAKLPLRLISQKEVPLSLEGVLPSMTFKKHHNALLDYLENGGLPGIFSLRNPRLRSEKLKDQVDLILDRDLDLVYSTRLSNFQIRDFVYELSKSDGELVHPSRLKKVTRLPEATQKKLLHALEAIFMVRIIPMEGDRKGHAIYFEDQLEHGYLHQSPFEESRAFEGLVYRNMRASFNYESGFDYRVFQYQERSGRYRVPFAFRSPQGILGVIPVFGKEPDSFVLNTAKRFLQTYNSSIVLAVTFGNAQTKVISSRILQIPAERILFEGI